MRMNNIYFVLLLLTASFIHSFQYDKAAYAAQKGEWQRTHEQISSLLIDNHDRADMLYDAGVAAEHLGQHEQALAYFSEAAHYAPQHTLKKQALFNAGNACVAAQRLPEALEKYEVVLSLDKDDEYARHNRDKVREMLQKQQEQNNNDQQNKDQKNNDQHNQDQQDQDKQNQDQKKDDQQNNSPSDQKQKGQSGENEQEGQDQQSSDSNDGQGKDKNQQGSKKQSTDKDGRDGADSSDGNNRKEQRDKKEKGEQSQQKDQRDSEQQSENKANYKQDERNSEQHKKHDAAPQKDMQKDTQQDTTVAPDGGKEQAQTNGANAGSAQHQGQDEMEKAFAEKINNPLLARILEQQEAKDKAMNKQLMEAKIRQSGGGNDAYNNW